MLRTGLEQSGASKIPLAGYPGNPRAAFGISYPRPTGTVVGPAE